VPAWSPEHPRLRPLRLAAAYTLEALRKLDQRFGMIERARRYAPRPYLMVVLSDHGQTQGATFRQRNGEGLDGLVERSLSGGVSTPSMRLTRSTDVSLGGVARSADADRGAAPRQLALPAA
jgi:hypothetical protein